MKNRVKKILMAYGLKGVAIKILRLLDLPLLFYYRRKLKKRIGAEKFAGMKNAQVITFPVTINRDVHLSSGGYAIEKMLYLIGKKPKAFNPWQSLRGAVFIEWQDLTRNIFKSSEFIIESLRHAHKHFEYNEIVMINGCATDISKKKVASCFADTFGYDLDINPTNYSGEIVVKSNENATHDGELINGPIEPSDVNPRKVYSVAINNIDSKGFATDYRLPYIGSCLNFCYIKKRPKSDRFSNTNESVEIAESSDIFSDMELKSIDEFCRAMGLDYGELDCLRDQNTDKLYVVDVAKTPSGPPNGISKRLRYAAIFEMSVAFVENLCVAPND